MRWWGSPVLIGEPEVAHSRDKEHHFHFLEKYTGWEAVSPASCWSIPLFLADFLHFASKIVELSRYLLILPPFSQGFTRLFSIRNGLG